ncbi:MAG: hypothetical protein H0T62_01725 [Parachlamydiaceae bacterium]|nr:hypothetical protein [Parachlamydiaceae bacterium]
MNPKLYDLIHGNKKSKIDSTEELSKYDIALEAAIAEEADKIMQAQDPNINKFSTPEQRKAQIAREITESINLDQMGDLLNNAFHILCTEGKNYLESESYEILIIDIQSMVQRLDTLDPISLDDNTLNKALNFSPLGIHSILKISIAKFEEGFLKESLALSTLLTILEPKEVDFWFRQGIIAKSCAIYDLAIYAFDVVNDLAPEFIGGYIIKAECYLDSTNKDQAIALMPKIKTLAETTIEEKWKKNVIDLETLLSA